MPRLLPVLPIDDHLPAIRHALRQHRAVVVTAAPGAGKTTRVPPMLVDDGPVLVLQPRRVAARAIARRIAGERGWTVGEEVGWHMRLDRRVSRRTKLHIATEGVLTAMALQDPLLSEFRTIVLDEFHERSLHADLGVAFARQAWRARDDLQLVVMSATLDAGRVATWLDGCPVIAVPGQVFPLTVEYRPGASIAGVAREASTAPGAVLCFLPGAAEIERARRDLEGVCPVFPLHGSLDADAQDAALRPLTTSRIVLATNLAETTVTVPDVTSVVDSGLQKVARYDAARGVDALVVERVAQDSADQRAGRAGRTGPGRVYRLWDRRDRLRPQREPDLLRVDLAGPVLDVLAWGADPLTFEWFESPPAHALDAALALLRQLGATDDRHRLTPLGRRLRSVPLSPRLARLFLAAGATREAARVCALLAEGRRTRPAVDVSSASDLDLLLDQAGAGPELDRLVAQLLARAGEAPDAGVPLHRAVFAAYADRLARRRPGSRESYLLASGTGAVLGRESAVREAEFLVALELASDGHAGQAPRIRLASAVDPAWITNVRAEVSHLLDGSGRVRAIRRHRVGAIVLREDDVEVDLADAARLLLEAWRSRPRTEDERQLAARLRCAGMATDLDALAAEAVHGCRRLDEVSPASALSEATLARLRRFAPETLTMPSGRARRLDYREDGSVVVAVKLQEVFGLADTPTVGVAATPVTFELLAPNQRPVQVTRDLRSFWARGYPEVRRELRGRYPRHPWPEDPWTAPPTHRTRPRAR